MKPLVRLPADTYRRRMAFDGGAGALGNRTGLELTESCSEESKMNPATFGQTLNLFVKMLPEKKGIEKNLLAKKLEFKIYFETPNVRSIDNIYCLISLREITTSIVIKNIHYSKNEISITLYYSNICNLHATPEGRKYFWEKSEKKSQEIQTKKTPNSQFVSSAHTIQLPEPDSNQRQGGYK